MKLAIVVQRYGEDVSGGAELHARYIAEHLARHADVRVFATCARDYLTWANHYPAGVDTVRGIPVERFPVARERNLVDFARRSTLVFEHTHSLQEELDWLDSQGPVSPALLDRLQGSLGEFDYVLFFCLRYHQTFHGASRAASRAVLVPTAERDPALGLSMFGPVLRGVRAIMYNTEEERALIQAVSGNTGVPGPVVGVGSEIPESVSAERARQKFQLPDRYLVYVGRIDGNKGFPQLFNDFLSYRHTSGRPLALVLIGTAVVDVPDHPDIRHLGFLDDQDKFDVVAGSVALVMPSRFESLSMVALEAWAIGRPVIANAACDVLAGQCLRSGAGLYYQDPEEFAGTIDAVLDRPNLAATLGQRGQQYFQQHYSWPVIEQKYLDMFARLSAEPPAGAWEAHPGWFARRQRNKPAAADVVAALPSGPVRPERSQSRP